MQTHETIGTAVSLYTGAGGMDIGFHRAGFQVEWANDIDKNATATYQRMFPKGKIITGSIAHQKLPIVKDLDLVIGGPPCQGFSVAGKMDPNDPRSQHVWNFLSVVNRLAPRAFVMENVKALAVNSRWSTLVKELIKEAQKLGYTTNLMLLNAADYGVPQTRERMFLVGIKKGVVVAPTPVTSDNWVSVRTALNALPKYGENGNNTFCTAKITLAKKPILRRSPYAGMIFNGQGRPLNLDQPALTLPASMGGNRTPIIDQQELTSPKNKSWIIEYHNSLLDKRKIEMEVPDSLRRITVEEAAALQTFPANLKFNGTVTTQFRQIGNAVPPVLAYHVAMAVRKALL